MTPQEFVDYAKDVKIAGWCISVTRLIKNGEGLPLMPEDQTVRIRASRYIGSGNKQQLVRRDKLIEPILLMDSYQFNGKLSVIEYIKDYIQDCEGLIRAEKIEVLE